MRYRHLYIAVLALGVILQGCSRVNPESPDDKSGVDLPEGMLVPDQSIGFSASSGLVETKSFIEPSNFNTAGNILTVNDILSFTGGICKYINAQPLTYRIPSGGTEYKWDLGTVYPWTRTGTHKFFGWLANDAALDKTADSFFGKTLSLESDNQTLNIPAKEMIRTSEQFDFLYSNIISRTMTNVGDDHSAVQLQMQHLFSAFGIGAVNTLKNVNVTLKSVKVQAIKSKKSASIVFGDGSAQGTLPTVTYTGTGATATFASTGEVVLECNSSQDAIYQNVMSGNDKKDKREYFMIWPQTVSDLPSNGCTLDSEDNVTAVTASDAVIEVVYTLGSATEEHTVWLPVTKAILGDSDPAGTEKGMDAGSRYHFDIIFADKLVSLKLSVLDWTEDNVDIDYADGSLSMANENYLKFDENVSIVSEADSTVILKQGRSALGQFKLNSPLGATVLISLGGANPDAFKVEFIQGEVIDGNTWTQFKIVPLVQNPTKNYSTTISISVRTASGQVVNADSLLKSQYTITLPAA